MIQLDVSFRPERLDGATVIGEHVPGCGAVAAVERREWETPWSTYVAEEGGTPPTLMLPCNDPGCGCKLSVPRSRVPANVFIHRPRSRQAAWEAGRKRKETVKLKRRVVDLEAENRWLRERVAQLTLPGSNQE